MTAAKSTLPVGSLWAVPAPLSARVEVTVPSGQVLTVVSYDEAALIVLTEPGEYVAGEHTVTAKA